MAMRASQQLSSEQALSRAASLCVASEHCIQDIGEKLARWGIEQNEAEKIIQRLLDEGYIDETRYALAYARDKLRFSHWGRQKIRMMLRMQHIPEALIREALDALDPEEYAEIALHVLRSKARTVKGPNAYAVRSKLIRFAMQRGFEMAVIQEALSAIYTGDCDDEMDLFCNEDYE